MKNKILNKRVRDESLDFKGIPSGEGVNGIHIYPAMFHSRLVRQLIEQFSEKNDYILDPFMGSGVAAVEAAVSNRKFIGFDLNPLAVLIAKTRTNPIPDDELKKALQKINKKYKVVSPNPPFFSNIDFWFAQGRKKSISKLLGAINSITKEDVQRFFLVALSATIRTVSKTRPDEFKLVRRKTSFYKPTIEVFNRIANRNIDMLERYYSEYKIRYKPFLETRNILLENLPVKDESVSLLITSPPYGDSQTTVAYGQFSRLSLQWLGLPHDGDKKSLGAKPITIEKDVPSTSLYEYLNKIQEKDTKRAMHVYSFYADLFQSLQKLVPKVKKGGYLIFVVGNRTVKGIQLVTDIIVSEMLEALGCKHLETRIRQISSKRMPLENSPTNIRGERSPTMKYEYIVITRRK